MTDDNVTAKEVESNGDAEGWGSGDYADPQHVEGLFACYHCGIRKPVTVYELATLGKPSCGECGRTMSIHGSDCRIRDYSPEDEDLHDLMRDAGEEWAEIYRMELCWDDIDSDTKRAYACVVALISMYGYTVKEPPDWSPYAKQGQMLRDLLDREMKQLPEDLRQDVTGISDTIRSMLEEVMTM